jgi:hypothetical protein
MAVPSLSLPARVGSRGVVVRRAVLEPEVLPAEREPAAVPLELPVFAAEPARIDEYVAGVRDRVGQLLDVYG